MNTLVKIVISSVEYHFLTIWSSWNSIVAQNMKGSTKYLQALTVVLLKALKTQFDSFYVWVMALPRRPKDI